MIGCKGGGALGRRRETEAKGKARGPIGLDIKLIGRVGANNTSLQTTAKYFLTASSKSEVDK